VRRVHPDLVLENVGSCFLSESLSLLTVLTSVVNAISQFNFLASRFLVKSIFAISSCGGFPSPAFDSASSFLTVCRCVLSSNLTFAGMSLTSMKSIAGKETQMSPRETSIWDQIRGSVEAPMSRQHMTKVTRYEIHTRRIVAPIELCKIVGFQSTR
jgi:hypothetical protein